MLCTDVAKVVDVGVSWWFLGGMFPHCLPIGETDE